MPDIRAFVKRFLTTDDKPTQSSAGTHAAATEAPKGPPAQSASAVPTVPTPTPIAPPSGVASSGESGSAGAVVADASARELASPDLDDWVHVEGPRERPRESLAAEDEDWVVIDGPEDAAAARD